MRKLLFIFCLTSAFIFNGVSHAAAQTHEPTPPATPKRVEISRNAKKRVTGIKINDESPAPKANNAKAEPPKSDESKPSETDEKKRAAKEAEQARVKAQQEADRRAAADAALEREKQAAAETAKRQAQEEFEQREKDLKKQIDDEKNAHDADKAADTAELEKVKAQADADRERLANEAKAEQQRLSDAAKADQQRLNDAAKAEQQRLVDEAKAEQDRITNEAKAEQERIAREAKTENERIVGEAKVARDLQAAQSEAEKKRLADEAAEVKRAADEQSAAQQAEMAKIKAQADEATRNREEAEKQAQIAQQAAADADTKRLESEKLAKDTTDREKAEKETMRQQLIELAAKKYKFLKIEDAAPLVAPDLYTAEEIDKALSEAVRKNPRLVKSAGFCDADFVGEPLDLQQSAPLTMQSLLEALRYKFGMNFLPDAEILELPVLINTSNEAWDVVLRTQLNYNDLEAKCTANNSIAIMKRSKYVALQDAQKKSEPIVTKLIKFKYLQMDPGGTVDVAGRSSSGGGKGAFESLEDQIQKLLKDDPRASVARAGTKNALIIRATETQLRDIQVNIDAADVPSYQVIVYATVYTANKNKLKNLGGSVSIVAGTGNLNRLGGINTFPSSTSSSSGSSSSSSTTGSTGSTGSTGDSSTSSPGSLVPGGVRSLGPGFAFPQSGGLSAGFSGIFGTTQFSAQLNALISNGIAEVQNNPTVVTDDNLEAKIDLGRQVPIAIPIFSGGVSGNANLQILNAGNTLAVTPQVIEDANGKPVKVRLSIQLESNEVDTSVSAQGIPTIQRRSAQNNITIGTDETVVIGGFTTLTKSKSLNKAPVLGDIPVIGYLFKNKIDQEQELYIYFAVRAEVRMDGTNLNPYPIQIDTTPMVPTDTFFKPVQQSSKPASQTPPKSN